VNPLDPPLGAIPPIPTKFASAGSHFVPRRFLEAVSCASHHDGLAAGAASSEAVTCEGSLDVTRYGGVLSARKLVGVRGAGYAFDGLYYVKSVTHKIKRGEYKQDFTLTRNGLVSTVQTVSP